MSKHLVVISCENHCYHGWQAKVATYSCMKRQGVAPLIVVHGAKDVDTHPAFVECGRAGALVLRSKNYTGEGVYRWAARNTAASLLDAEQVGRVIGAEYLVLLDPDMLWTRKVQWPSRLAVDKVCLEGLTDAAAREVAEAMGTTIEPSAPCRIGARVPYVIPMEHAKAIGDAWWLAMEHFATRETRVWSDQMIAFCLALLSLDLRAARMRFSQTDWDYRARVTAPMLHYAYGSPYFKKKHYVKEDEVSKLWLEKFPLLPTDSAQGWVLREIEQAKAFYDTLKEAACA